ncbi:MULTISPECIES: hypothetical protein [unclassified Gilliamella]|uniref:hypothetical protein n=1 Tax=unclassified Gilliamella TaxID=2685620 RepID=UPI0011471C6D|nr:hypothetical protein [Gilliamella apicola]
MIDDNACAGGGMLNHPAREMVAECGLHCPSRSLGFTHRYRFIPDKIIPDKIALAKHSCLTC